MKAYRNVKTGNVIAVDCNISGGDWEEVVTPEIAIPEKPPKNEKPPKKEKPATPPKEQVSDDEQLCDD